MNYKTETFLWGMVKAEIFSFRNVDKDFKALELSRRLSKEMGEGEGNESNFPYFYATRLVYTNDLIFKWKKTTPSEYMALETWWNMVKAGEPPLDCYVFYSENVANPVTFEWQDALERAHTIWTPAEEDYAEDEDSIDPNS